MTAVKALTNTMKNKTKVIGFFNNHNNSSKKIIMSNQYKGFQF